MALLPLLLVGPLGASVLVVGLIPFDFSYIRPASNRPDTDFSVFEAGPRPFAKGM